MFFLFQAKSTFANDSTLYKERLEKLREFSIFLKGRTINIHNKFDFDSSSSISKFYDSSLSLFFNLALLKSKYLSNGDAKFETPEFNLKFLKNCIAFFHSLSLTVKFSKFKFKSVQRPLWHPEPITLDYEMETNSIIYYTITKGKEQGHLVFIFEPGKSELIGIDSLPTNK